MIVADEARLVAVLRQALSEHGYPSPAVAESVATAMAALDRERVEAMLVDRGVGEHPESCAAGPEENDRRLAMLLSNLPGMAYRFRNDRSRTAECVSQGARHLTGYSHEELADDRVADFGDLIHPDDRDRVWQATQRACAEGSPLEIEYRIRTRSGAERFVWERGAPDPSANEVFEGIILDVSGRQQAERALRLSEDKFHAFFESAPDACCIVSLEGLILAANPATDQLLGRKRQDVVGRVLADSCTPETRRVAGTLGERLLAQGRVADRELEVVASDGARRAVTLTASVVRAVNGTPLYAVVILRDVTAERQMAAQLLQAQKMEAVGRLAGGIAHDFNNLMGIISGYGEMIRKAAPEDGPIGRRVEQILETADKAAAITRQLLAFSRQEVAEVVPVDLNGLVRNVEGMLGRLIGEDVTLAVELSDGLGVAALDAGQIEQALLNLVVNARDAMPRGGRVTIATANVDFGQPEPAYADEMMAPGPYVRLTVTDTGAGMDPATQARLFEPFFTTKPVGKGTGLGLSVVYGVVRNCAGHIVVQSAPGQGTAFHLYFPRSVGASPEAVPQGELAAAAGGHETIMVVEDEEALREIIVDILTSLGYRVLTEATGLAALDLAKRSGERIDLLISDIVMPHMRGDELAFALSALQPELRVLFISGYPDEVAARFGMDLNQAPLLEKPFKTSTLARKVREALGSPAYAALD